MIHPIKHFCTIQAHRNLVLKYCFKIGLYKQGLLHDLSKFSFSEFWVGAKYYQGDRSPNNAEREKIGFSSAWLHHKGRNKHHFEYWIDYNLRRNDNIMTPAPMPNKYIAEMMMDRIAACRIYQKKKYTVSSPLEYYNHSAGRLPLHPYTKEQLEKMLYMLKEHGEEYTLNYIKNDFLKSPEYSNRMDSKDMNNNE